jgi:predicted transcriptional regulator
LIDTVPLSEAAAMAAARAADPNGSASFPETICYTVHMTKLLEQAIAKARELTDEEQDSLALTILALTEGDASMVPLDDETRAAILEGLEQARRGEFVPDQEIEALWKRHGL